MTDRPSYPVQLRLADATGEAVGDLTLDGIRGFTVRTRRSGNTLSVAVYHGERLCGSDTLRMVEDLGDKFEITGRYWHGQIPVDGCHWIVQGVVGSGLLVFRSPMRPGKYNHLVDEAEAAG